ncbi:MAG: restriction endonuclease subunit S [Mycobacterium sp.]
MSDWLDVTLSDLVQHVDERRGDEKVSTVLSVTEKRGIIPQREVFKKRIATDDTSKYKVLQPLDIAYNPYLLWTGAIGQWLGSQAGVTSPVYETFRTRTEHDARFVGLLLTSGALTPYFDATAIGSIQRRRRTPVSVFLAAPTLVPPLADQRRIVAVMSAIDTHIESLQAELAAERAMRRPLLSDLLSHGGAAPTELGAIGTFIRGRRFTKAQFTDGGLGCIHYAEVHTHFGPIATETRQFLDNDLRTQMRLARPGDVIVAATSENLADLGKATVWLGNSEVAVHDDCYIYRHELDPRFASYLFASAEFQRQKVQFATGTKVTRISGENLGKIKVPIPPYATQVEIGQKLTFTDVAAAARLSELAALCHVRTELLTALLSQIISIGEAVDQFIEPAAA